MPFQQSINLPDFDKLKSGLLGSKVLTENYLLFQTVINFLDSTTKLKVIFSKQIDDLESIVSGLSLGDKNIQNLIPQSEGEDLVENFFPGPTGSQGLVGLRGFQGLPGIDGLDGERESFIIGNDRAGFARIDGVAVDNQVAIWSSPNKLEGDANFTWDGSEVILTGSMHLLHTALEADDHALELDIDAAGFGDVKALDIDYITGAIAGGQDEAVILVNIDESLATGGDVTALEVLGTEGSASLFGLFAGVLVNPIEQLSGTFANADTVNNDGSVITTLDSGGGGNVAIFTSNNDFMIIGSAAKFEEIEYLLDTGSSGAGIKPTFEFSTSVGNWTAFTPVDGTNAMRNSGVIAFLDSDIPTWAVGAGTEFLIRITRTRTSLTTPPIADKLQIAAATVYFWDKDGDIKSRTYESDIVTGTAPLVVASTTLVTNLNADLLDGVQGAEFLQRDGSVPLTANWDVGDFRLTMERLDIIKEGAALVVLTGYGNNTQFVGFRTSGTEASPTATAPGLLFQIAGGGHNGSGFTFSTASVGLVAVETFTGSAEGTRIQFENTDIGSTTRREIARISPPGNFLLGTTLDPGTGTESIIFGDGTAPSTMASNTAGLYANDVSGTVEMFAIDEADNSSQLTPHNFSLFTPDVADPFPWSYYSKNPYLGIEINVDIAKLARLVEQLTNEQIIYTRALPQEEKLSWIDIQRHNVKNMQVTYERWERDRDQFLPEPNEPDFLELAPPIPVIKKPPEWLLSRLVNWSASDFHTEQQKLAQWKAKDIQRT